MAFRTRDEDEYTRRVINGEWSFQVNQEWSISCWLHLFFRYNPIKTSNPFDYITPEGKSLVEKLIQIDPDSRPSANEVLNCDWLYEFDYEEVCHCIYASNNNALFPGEKRVSVDTRMWQPQATNDT